VTENTGVRFFDAVVATTPTIARRFPASQTVVVHNYPLLKQLEVPQETPYQTRDPLLVYVGYLSAGRGVRQMVKAMAALPRSLDARLMLAGIFDPDHRESRLKGGLEAICRDLPGWQHVTYLGWQSRQQVTAVLGRARVGVVTLLPLPNYLDALPVKLFEYMAAGLPVVASNFPLWRRIIEHAGCGLLVDPTNPEEIAEACRHLLEHPAKAEAMGQQGREAVSRIYNWDMAARELLLLYQRLLRDIPNPGSAVALDALPGGADRHGSSRIQ
jgi:glycosyltransferase involved in cell wall biosynthesis